MYQWLKDGEMIDGGTEPVLQLPSVTPEWEGHYQCRVTNTNGVALSSSATVTLEEFAPRLVEQPAATLSVPHLASGRINVVGMWPS